MKASYAKASRVPSAGCWLNVFFRATDGNLYISYLYAETRGSAYLGPTSSNPSLTSWATNRIDVFTLDASGTLVRRWYEEAWSLPARSTGLVPTAGKIAAVSREPGTLDVLVSRGGEPVWHAYWPRLPHP